MSVAVNIDANGGSCPHSVGYVRYGQAYGDMPTPTRQGYKFVGWFTLDGDEITSATVMAQTTTQTMVAHWENQAVVRLVENGAVKTITQIYDAASGTVKPLLGIYVVENGQVKQAT